MSQNERLNANILGRLYTVSYTHLDVYKRQQQLTEVSSQSDEWYRNAYGTKKERNKKTFIFIDIDK